MFGGFSIGHLLTGLTMVAIGIVMVKFSFQLLNITGPQQWLERYTGSGSTNGIYKLLGIALILLGFMFATGFGQTVLDFIFSPLKGIFHSVNGG